MRKTPQTYKLARIAVLSALSAVGSFIHLPGSMQTVTFDSAPGFFAALFYGPLDGAIVCGVGHLTTSIVNGFPLGVLHLPIALGLAFAGAAMGSVNRRFGYAPGVAIGVAINTALILVVVPVLGWSSALAFLPFLLFAASANALLATFTCRALKRRIGEDEMTRSW